MRTIKRLFSSSAFYRFASSHMSRSNEIKRVSIEGNIAVGKSTFAKLLQNAGQDWEVIAEPVSKWQNVDQTTRVSQSSSNLLEMMYHDPKRWSYTFQTFSCMSRMRTHLQPLAARLLQSTGTPVQVYERSVYSDRCFLTHLKGSYDVAKKNSIWCNEMCLCGLRFKKHIIFHILYIIVSPLCPAFLKRVDFYKAHRSEKARCAVIGQLSSAL
uniref:Deoxyguanosine kinase, mitochondrial-like n=1 Tax=Sinocyclocheilus grahami TaxID=75366 RepID=A0A672QA74_SINGR